MRKTSCGFSGSWVEYDIYNGIDICNVDFTVAIYICTVLYIFFAIPALDDGDDGIDICDIDLAVAVHVANKEIGIIVTEIHTNYPVQIKRVNGLVVLDYGVCKVIIGDFQVICRIGHLASISLDERQWLIDSGIGYS